MSVYTLKPGERLAVNGEIEFCGIDNRGRAKIKVTGAAQVHRRKDASYRPPNEKLDLPEREA